ncbi:MAG: hypothetical protein WAZ94_12460 [Phycisphaerales bacterium]
MGELERADVCEDGGRPGGLACLAQHGQQQADELGDERDRDQQLDEREGSNAQGNDPNVRIDRCDVG